MNLVDEFFESLKTVPGRPRLPVKDVVPQLDKWYANPLTVEEELTINSVLEDQAKFTKWTIALGLVNESGQRVFDDDNFERVGQMDAGVAQKLFLLCLKANGITPAHVDAAKKTRRRLVPQANNEDRSRTEQDVARAANRETGHA